MRAELQQHLHAVVGAVLSEGGDLDPVPEFALDVPKKADHGDFACNAAMLLAKRLRRPPREIAEDLATRLRESPGTIERVEVAGPGFVNIWLVGHSWRGLLPEVLAAGARYGRNTTGAGRKVQVEFVSANPTGPLTLGHGRQAVLGDAIAQLLQASGYEVTREYYFNNGGRQMRVL